MDQPYLVLFTLAATSAALLFFGIIFGMVAVPTLNEKLGLVCIFIPVLVIPVCLLNYRKTRYASNFLLAGLLVGLLTGVVSLGV